MTGKNRRVQATFPELQLRIPNPSLWAAAAGAQSPHPTPPPWHADVSSVKLRGPQKSDQGRTIWRRELFGLLNISLRVRHTQGTRGVFQEPFLHGQVEGYRLPSHSPLALWAASLLPNSFSPTPKWTSAHPQAP